MRAFETLIEIFMRHNHTTLMECVGVLAGFCGTSFATLGLSQTFNQQNSPNEELLLSIGCNLIISLPTLYVGIRMDQKFEASPPTMLCSSFLLASSSFILSFIIDKCILSTLVPSLDPFNLPMMLTAAASTSVIAGMGLIAKNNVCSPFSAISQCASSFFIKCITQNNQAETVSNLPTTRTPLSSDSEVLYTTLEGVNRPLLPV